MNSQLKQNFFKQNRQKLYESLSGKFDLVVITANRLQQRNADSTYNFRQESNFYYLTGINQPAVILVAQISKGREWLIAPKRTKSEIIFDGTSNFAQWTNSSGIDSVYDYETGWNEATRLKDVINSVGINKNHFIGSSLNDSQKITASKLKRQFNRAELSDITSYILRLRAVKQDVEIDLINQAINITAQAMKSVTDQIDKYGFEYEIEAEITKVIRSSNARHAYEPIIAGGKNALTLHYSENNSALQTGELLLLDVGAEVDCYASDITRTVPIAKSMTTRQQQVYDGVRAIQDYAVEQIQPGRSFKEYEDLTNKYVQLIVSQLGLKQPWRKYLPHSISHAMGLDVHDSFMGHEFRPGMVLTVEPGLYITQENMGIRIEDDILVTQTGTKVLSQSIPK
jgi:Xaa-Pro aminopeptidase